MDIADHFDPHELADRFAGVVSEATSDGGHVTVLVDAKGRVSDIRLDAKLAGVSLDRLAEALTELCGKAFDDRIDQLSDVVDQYERECGLSSEVLSFLRSSVASLRDSGTETGAPRQEEVKRAADADFAKPDMLDEDPLGRRRTTSG